MLEAPKETLKSLTFFSFLYSKEQIEETQYDDHAQKNLAQNFIKIFRYQALYLEQS